MPSPLPLATPTWVFSCRLWLMVLALWTAASAHAEPLRNCRITGFQTEVQCGTLRRALDPAKPAGVQIEVHYVVVPALARRKLPDPVFFLAGGPGQSAIHIAPSVARRLARLNNRRDLVFVDQRGTGRSAPLYCEEDRKSSLAQQMDMERTYQHLAQCLAQLQKLPYGDTRFFTTVLAMQDLDAVRQALVAAQINLIGGSYGTRAALDYLRQFPTAVRRTVLDGVAPADMSLPSSASSDNQTAFDAMLGACETEPRCAKAYPRLRADWAALLSELPRQASVANPRTGVPERVTITREAVLGGVRSPLYFPSLAAALPHAITEATQGRFEAMLGLGSMFAMRGPNRMAEGMHFSVICAEDAPRAAEAAVGAGTDKPGTDFASSFAQVYAKVCANWPVAAVPAAFYTLPPAQSPVLVLSGGLDPVTPPRHGERVTKALGTQARHVVVANAGHGVIALGCMADVLTRFIDAPDSAAATKVDAACAQSIPRPPAFLPLGLSSKQP